jgi:hypothetical protein
LRDSGFRAERGWGGAADPWDQAGPRSRSCGPAATLFGLGYRPEGALRGQEPGLPTANDARSLYQALRPLGDVELIVDDHESHHGLAFYSERDVEYVSGLGATPESVQTIPIADELAEETRANEEPHLYLVRRPRATRLDELLRKARATIRARQEVGAFQAIWTKPGAETGGSAGEWRWAGPRAMPPG